MQTKQDIIQPVFQIYSPGSIQRHGTPREMQGKKGGHSVLPFGEISTVSHSFHTPKSKGNKGIYIPSQ